MKRALNFSRVFLLVSLAVTLWMLDCAGEMSVSRNGNGTPSQEPPANLKAALAGFHSVGIPVQIERSLETLSHLLPTPADRTETEHEQRRDFIFIGAYTLGYLGLARLLAYRTDGIGGRRFAWIAAALVLFTAVCDVVEDNCILRVLPCLAGDYRELGAPAPRATVTPAEETAAHDVMLVKCVASYGKWFASFVLSGVLAFVFFRKEPCWQNVAGYLLLGGGLLGLAGALFKPCLIEWAFVITAMGSLLGTLWLLRVPTCADLWKPPSDPGGGN